MDDRARTGQGSDEARAEPNVEAPAVGDPPAECATSRGRVTYIGHATVLIEVGGKRILTDPNFDPALARFLKRVCPPGIPIHELPALDAILITHAHADHLSFTSLASLPQDVPLYAPPPIQQWLHRAGYRQARPIEAGAGIDLGSVTIHGTPAQHRGSRYGIDQWRNAANMYLLETADATCFFAGDTGLTPRTHHLVEEVLHSTGRELDIALLPIGYAPWWKPGFRRGHLTSDDALALFERLKARYLIPYHWGTFHHLTAGPYDAITRLRASLSGHPRHGDVKVLEPGTSFDF